MVLQVLIHYGIAFGREIPDVFSNTFLKSFFTLSYQTKLNLIENIFNKVESIANRDLFILTGEVNNWKIF